ncbi:multidrug ABC transporter ATP-binding protein [Halomonas sp. SF2003]|nr:multidrug ABC transporter ATP-binding protein [Halomonas sp. SF2003]
MFSQLKELYLLLTSEQQIKLKRLQVLVVIMAFAEIMGVASIGPFMALVGDIGQLNEDGLIGKIYQISGLTNPHDFLFWLGIGVLVILTLAALVSMYTVWQLSLYGQKVGAELSSRLFRYYMHQPWLFHASGSSSELTNKVSQECQRITNSVINPVMKMNAKLVLASLMLLCIFIYNPLVALAGFVIFLIAYSLLFRTVRKKLIYNGGNVSNAQQLRFKLLGEGLGGIKDVLLLGRQDIFTRRFDMASIKFAKSQGTNEALSMSPRYAMELVAFGSVIFLILYLLSEHEGDLGSILPVLSVYALAGFKLLPAFQQIYTSLSNIRGGLAAFSNLREDLKASKRANEVSDGYANSEIDEENNQVIPKVSVSLRNVSFNYPEAKKSALENISIDIPVNNVIGLVGASGSGKSTAIDMILGLISPDRGTLLVDDVPVCSNNLRKWQNSIGFVPQSIFLSDNSIRENIAFGLPEEEIDDQRIKNAVALAHLEELIQELPDGIMTRVGERGVQLSGGQRQRIGIARALYDDADILIFDEATSALDGITEKTIMDAIHNFADKKTIIMIAHRLATVKECDCIYMMQKGKIVDSGSYQELCHNNNLFNIMANNS